MANRTIIKVKKKQNPFVQIDRSSIQDQNLSWKARGMLAYLLSLPEDWKIYIEELQKNSNKDGRDSTASALKELMNECYATRERLINERGQFAGYIYNIYETPINKEIEPKTENPFTGKPFTENPQLHIKDNTNKTITNKKIIVGKPDSTDFINSSEHDKKEKDSKQDNAVLINEVIKYLNDKTNKQFKSTTGKYVTLINKWVKAGYTLEDFKKVIDVKCTWWLHDADMSQFLRPSTLFGSKFDEYLNEKPKSEFAKVDKKEPWKNFKQRKYTSDTFESLYANVKPFKTSDVKDMKTDREKYNENFFKNLKKEIQK